MNQSNRKELIRAVLTENATYDQAMLSETEYEHSDKSDWIIPLQIISPNHIRDEIKFIIDEIGFRCSADQMQLLKSEPKDLLAFLKSLSLLPSGYSAPAWDNNLHNPVYKNVIKQLSSYGVRPSQEHDLAIKLTIRTMMDAYQPPLPIVLPIPPGFGKTTILKELIIHQLNSTKDWSALVVLDRFDDIYKQINEIRSRVNNPGDIAIWPTFRSQLKCPAGTTYFQPAICTKCQQKCPVKSELHPNKHGIISEPTSFQDVKTCPAGYSSSSYQKGICNNCVERKRSTNRCPVLPTPPSFHNDKRVVYVTHEFYYRMISFNIVRVGLTKYGENDRQVYIDERPRLAKTYQEHLLNLLDIRTLINMKFIKHLPKYDDALLSYIDLFKDQTNRYVESSQRNLDKGLLIVWGNKASKLNLNPDGLVPFQMVLENGGYYESKSYDKKAHATTAVKYLTRLHSNNRTIILDGTGQFDKLYDRNQYFIESIASNLTYSNLHIHFCNLELSKRHYERKLKSDKDYILKFCNEIIRLSGNDDTLVLCYKDCEPEFEKWLGLPYLSIEHFGNILGKNNYSTAVNVVFTGVLTFAEADYGAMDLAVNGMCDKADINDRIRIIELNQKLVQIFQEVYRSKLRHHNPADTINVYIPTNNQELQKLIMYRFPGATESVWLPKPVFANGDLLLSIVRNNPSINKREAVRQYKQQTHAKPTSQEIYTTWPGISRQHASNLRAGN